MPTTHSHDSDKGWARRHRLQHQKPAPLPEKTTQRFAREFEQALQARGAAAKEAANA